MKKAVYIVCIVIESLVLVMGAFFAWVAMTTQDRNTDPVTPMRVGMFALAFLIISIICLAKKLGILSNILMKLGGISLVVGIILYDDGLQYLIACLLVTVILFAISVKINKKSISSDKQ